jgi:hypothetical protein
MEREAHRHRAYSEHRRLHAEQLGDIRFLLCSRRRGLENPIGDAIHFYCCSLWHCAVVAGIPKVRYPTIKGVSVAYALMFRNRWLVSKGRVEEAELILADVEGSEIEDPYVQTELEEIKFAAAYEKEHAVRITDLLRGRVGANDPCTLRRVLLGMGK